MSGALASLLPLRPLVARRVHTLAAGGGTAQRPALKLFCLLIVRRVLIDAERPRPGGVAFGVLPPMPRLDVSLVGLESTLLAGEVVRCTLKLRNTGAMALQSLSMAASKGIYVESDSSTGASAAAGASSVATAVRVHQRQGQTVFVFPPDLKLAVGQEVGVRLFCERKNRSNQQG